MKKLGLLSLFLIAVLPAWAVNPRHNGAISIRSSSGQTIADSTPVLMTMGAVDFPYSSALYSVSNGVVTLKASGLYRITMHGNEYAGAGTYIFAIYFNGSEQIYRTRGDSRDDMSGGPVLCRYYEAGSTIAVYLLNVGGDVDIGSLTIELLP